MAHITHQRAYSPLPPRYRLKAQWNSEQSSSTTEDRFAQAEHTIFADAQRNQTATATSSATDLPTNSLSTAITLPSRKLTPDSRIFRFLWFEHEKAKSAHHESTRILKAHVTDQDARVGLTARRITIQQALDEIWVEGPKSTAAVMNYFKTKKRLDLVESVICEQYAKHLRSPSPSTASDITDEPSSTPIKSVTHLPEPEEEKASTALETDSTLPPVIRTSRRLQEKSAAARGSSLGSSPAPVPAVAASSKPSKGKKRAREEEEDGPVKPSTVSESSTRLKRRRSSALTSQSDITPPTEIKSSPKRARLGIKISCDPPVNNRIDGFGKPQLSPSLFRGKENAFEFTH